MSTRSPDPSKPDPSNPDRRGALREAIAAFTPIDAQESGHRTRMLELLRDAADPFDRNAFAPGHFTASAFVLSPRRDALLLILHGKLNRWLQPGGHIEPDDTTVPDAAMREAREETGLSELSLLSPLPFDLDVHDLPPYGGNPGHAHFDVRYLLQAGNLDAAADSDAKDARFFSFSEIDAEHSDRSVTRAVEKLGRLLGSGGLG